MDTTPGLNFTNIFKLSFYARRSRKRKKTDDLTVFFMLLGSVSVKAVRRTLMKLSPALAPSFINPVLREVGRREKREKRRERGE